MKIIQVGYGYWGESWLQFIADDPNSELAALVVRTPETLKKAQDKWGLRDDMCFTDYDKALELEADLVVIVMPHYAHIDFAKKAVLPAHWKHTGATCMLSLRFCQQIRPSTQIPWPCGGRHSWPRGILLAQ